jgi:prepilin-type N-terminal cleavage/methylation domain-containing protein
MMTQLKSLQARKEQEGEEGFTLIELLIVIVVLGILAAVVVFALGGVTGTAKTSACNADSKTVETAVQAYDADPPTNCTTNCTIGLETTTLLTAIPSGDILLGTPSSYSAGTNAAELVPSYLKAWPGDTNGYAISLAYTGGLGDNGVAGDVVVYVPATATAGVAYDTESTTSGCHNTSI